MELAIIESLPRPDTCRLTTGLSQAFDPIDRVRISAVNPPSTVSTPFLTHSVTFHIAHNLFFCSCVVN